MSLHTQPAFTEQKAERLLAWAMAFDPRASMYREDNLEGSFWVVCYHWPLPKTASAPAVSKGSH